MHAKIARALAGSAIAIASRGCAEAFDEELPEPLGAATGALVATWTIEGTTDPASCAFHGVEQMRLVVFDARGLAEATRFAPCGAFEATVALAPGTYSVTATFVSAGVAVSDELSLVPFTIVSNETVVRSVDFPADALR